jgi:hypothetical protein
MIITCLLTALVVARCIAAIEFVLLVALVRRLAMAAALPPMVRMADSLVVSCAPDAGRMQCHMQPSRACQDTREQHQWTWADIEDAIRTALATDITMFCQAVQEVAA